MPRRVYTYLPESGWTTYNTLASVGAALLGLSVLLYVANLAASLRYGAPAGADPWRADSLEWSIPSPAPAYNFARMPVVDDRHPLWRGPDGLGTVTGLRSDIREVLVTTALDAEPDHRHILDGPSVWPFLTAVGVAIGVIASIFTPWGAVVGAAICLVTLTGWFWPRGESIPGTAQEEAPR